MKILSILYGQFPEVFRLYSKFQPGLSHLKVVIDIEPAGGFDRAKFLTVFRQLSEFFPTISQHSCCEEWQSIPLYIEQEKGVSIKRVGECADVAHMIEHVIVDMQVNLGGMTRCSGLTCGWKNPENRFDLFIECTVPRIGLFAAQFAVHVVSKIMMKELVSRKYKSVLELARHLRSETGRPVEVAALARKLGWRVGLVEMALSRLQEFGYFVDTNSEYQDGEVRSA